MFDRLSFLDLSRYKIAFNFIDAVDILLVALVIYWLIVLIKDTRAEQLIKGIVLLIIINFISDWCDLNTLNYILSKVIQVGLIALLIIFQPELRRGLEKIGRKGAIRSIFKQNKRDTDEYEIEMAIQSICNACHIMAERKIGALIIIERDTKLTDIINTGISVNSSINSSLLITIFTPNTPLHDGAVVIRDYKLVSASCFLPLTQSRILDSSFGTRHRAALGISEISDCITIVVSEETGNIAVADNGNLTNNLNSTSLLKLLKSKFMIS